ncbi:hypothetical protein CO614_03200 [Lysobacteraceae bacterium NML120232]|nr:hypothetical protein CO614_03200 [Xanthomonadaceae bacterium NML120232]
MPTIPATPAGFRRHQLDGAMLYFQPQTGIHLRVQNAATRDCVRQAPRAVMMGITNLCNLQCGFCSRDIAARSLWTVDSAFELLHGLYAAGTLEVAFGGGEPLLFKGFAELVQRLQAHTDLALNLTTNGSRVSHELWQSLQGGIRMARLSIYPETDIARIAVVWQAQKQRWGANVLVDDAALATLPQLLEELAARGAQDVSILTYVGEPARLLSASGRERLQAIIRQAPLPCRLSVCAGDMGCLHSLPVLLLPIAAPGMTSSPSAQTSICRRVHLPPNAGQQPMPSRRCMLGADNRPHCANPARAVAVRAKPCRLFCSQKWIWRPACMSGNRSPATTAANA